MRAVDFLDSGEGIDKTLEEPRLRNHYERRRPTSKSCAAGAQEAEEGHMERGGKNGFPREVGVECIRVGSSTSDRAG